MASLTVANILRLGNYLRVDGSVLPCGAKVLENIPPTSGAGAPPATVGAPTVYTDTSTGDVYYRDAAGTVVQISAPSAAGPNFTGTSSNAALTVTAGGTQGHAPVFSVNLQTSSAQALTLGAGGLFVPNACAQILTATVGTQAAGDVMLARDTGGNCKQIPVPTFTPATACTVGATVNVAPAANAVTLLAIDAANCIIKVVPNTVEIRDCNNNLVSRFLAIPA